jgi:hypothetical protein
VHKSSAVQINGLRITETRSRNPRRDPRFGSGHWGVHNGGTADLLVNGFDISPNLLHAVGSDAFGMYAVFTKGRMANGNLELHRWAGGAAWGGGLQRRGAGWACLSS